jgi:hypothetical protein
VRENRYYSEDWTFCENWRDLGGQVYIDKRVLLKHVGTYVFDAQTQDKLYQDLHAIAAPKIANAHDAAKQPVDITEPEIMASSTPVDVVPVEEPATAK